MFNILIVIRKSTSVIKYVKSKKSKNPSDSHWENITREPWLEKTQQRSRKTQRDPHISEEMLRNDSAVHFVIIELKRVCT